MNFTETAGGPEFNSRSSPFLPVPFFSAVFKPGSRLPPLAAVVLVTRGRSEGSTHGIFFWGDALTQVRLHQRNGFFPTSQKRLDSLPLLMASRVHRFMQSLRLRILRTDSTGCLQRGYSSFRHMSSVEFAAFPSCAFPFFPSSSSTHLEPADLGYHILCG